MMSAFESLSEIKPPLYPLSGYLRVQPPSISETDAIRIAELLIAAHNPAMICGRGVHAAKAYQEVQELAELLGMPVATSYMGKSSIPEIHPLAVGTIAGLGQKVANKVVRGADVLLTVGSALSADNTNNCSPDLINPMEQRIIHIDIEPRNAGWTYPITLGITSDAKLALRAIINVIQAKKPTIDVKGRQAKLDALKQSPESEFFTSKFFTVEDAPLNPERVVKAINDLIRPEDKIILDGGNNRMWFTKLFRTKSTNQLIGPGGAAGMAWCASAVITSSMIYTEGRSIGIIGDGGMLMALYNLETIKQYNANPIIVVLNNATYGNPRDYLSAKGAAYCDYDNVNFKKIGEAMCVNARRVTTIDELNSEFKNALENPQATILDVVVKPASHIRIKVM
mgnify:CR=1 FL=1